MNDIIENGYRRRWWTRGRAVRAVATLAVLLAVGGVASAAPAGVPVPEVYPTVAVGADGCASLSWLTSSYRPRYSTYLSELKIHRQGHFWTSQTCGALISYWGEGQAFERSASTDVRIVLYDRNHNHDRSTPWVTVRGGGVPAVWSIPRGREFSFDTRHHTSSQRSRESHALYEPIRF